MTLRELQNIKDVLEMSNLHDDYSMKIFDDYWESKKLALESIHREINMKELDLQRKQDVSGNEMDKD